MESNGKSKKIQVKIEISGVPRAGFEPARKQASEGF